MNGARAAAGFAMFLLLWPGIASGTWGERPHWVVPSGQ